MRLGPIVGATLVVRSLERALDAYAGGLGLVAGSSGRLSRQRALDMGDAALADAACVQLRSAAASDACLTLIEVAHATPTTPVSRRGWIAMSLAVADVDALAGRLDRRLWPVLAEPAEVPGGRALQLAGADGEVLLLAQAAPASSGPRFAAARCPVDGIVAATLAVRDRATALGFYGGLGLLDRWCVDAPPAAPGCATGDSRVRAIGQLRGEHLIEIDQQPSLPAADATLRSGIRMLSFARSDARGTRLTAHADPSARILAGPEGEAIELV